MSSEPHGDAADDTAENAKGTADQEYQVGVEEVDAADVSNKEGEGLQKRGKQFLEVRKAPEMPTQDTGTTRERKLAKRSVLERTCSCEFRVTRERESSLPGRGSREQDTSKVKEN